MIGWTDGTVQRTILPNLRPAHFHGVEIQLKEHNLIPEIKGIACGGEMREFRPQA
jgi:hypothetical protein